MARGLERAVNQLADLPAAYAQARAAATAARKLDDPPPLTCRYCGKLWRPWAGSKHDGHVACVVPLEFQRALLKLYRAVPGLSMQTIATTCSVTLSTVNRWLRNAERMVAA